MKTFTGIVKSVKMKDTVIVEVTRRTPHPLYKKLLKRSSRFKVSSPANTAVVGHEVTIGETPVVLTVESPSSTTSGDEFTTTISVAMKSNEILKNVVLKAEYPYGYSVTSASPSAVAEPVSS